MGIEVFTIVESPLLAVWSHTIHGGLLPGTEVTPLTIGVVGRSLVELAHTKCSLKSYWINKQISNFSLTNEASLETNF